jgi:prepilin-type N-terminal cleavage/methylation domain-containing protein
MSPLKVNLDIILSLRMVLAREQGMKRYFQQGISLLELLLVLVIVAVLVVLAAKRYKSYQEDSNIAIMRETITTLVTGFNQYYFAHCSLQDWPKPITLAALNLPQTAQVSNPFGSMSYVFGIRDSSMPNKGNPTYYLRQLYIQIPLDPKYNSETMYFQNALRATSVLEKGGSRLLEWAFPPVNPNQLSQDPTDPNWLMQISSREYLLKVDPANPCWFPPTTNPPLQ